MPLISAGRVDSIVKEQQRPDVRRAASLKTELCERRGFVNTFVEKKKKINVKYFFLILELYKRRGFDMSKNNIRKIITDKGLTVPDAARLCGLPLSTVSAHFYGQRKSMTLHIAAKYSHGLGVSIDDLLPENLK